MATWSSIRETGLTFKLWGCDCGALSKMLVHIFAFGSTFGPQRLAFWVRVCAVCTQLGVVCWKQVHLTLHSNICRNIRTCSSVNLHKSQSPHFLCSSHSDVFKVDNCGRGVCTCAPAVPLFTWSAPVHSGHPTIAHLGPPQVDASHITNVHSSTKKFQVYA